MLGRWLMGSVKGREGERLRVEGIIGCGYG